ncbi:hypothetical protein E1262_00855 [Jiangella aurantiaca]|uniref:Uncharacterized protein n=1 Tax=Jiangella aurantiaca TaxID=2530373 RepID=A0A4R5AN62_9ACTN|nr:hypothetical protein [Jiangella aurantiaca]TDD73069.1 hypothetical protein E1262_00855 [Jiangella aurantiaca]
MRKSILLASASCAALMGAAVLAAPVATAHAPSGAIFTTLPDGSEVNFNIYDSKDDVYLDGGPGIGAPQDAAGLDDGTYVFQVTDPSGKVLLSQDPARCRQFTVAGGVITGVVDTDCEHATGVDVDHNAVTVQLMPYADTPNNGGEYKVWVTTVEDFLAGCAEFGVPNGLNVIDCGSQGGNKHGFVGGHSKTDNFKVGPQRPMEIDTRFWKDGQAQDGFGVTWTDTHGAKNKKYSYWAPELMVFHEAHVEAVEVGRHHITIADQPGCVVHDVSVDGRHVGQGARTVSVDIRRNMRQDTVFVDVDCE